MKPAVWVVGLLALAAGSAAALAEDATVSASGPVLSTPVYVTSPDQPLPVREWRQAAAESFMQTWPGASLLLEGTRITRVYGVPFGTGASPGDTAEQFRLAHSGIWGVDPEDLLPTTPVLSSGNTLPLMYDPDLGDYKFTLVYYSQFRAGVPVFRSDLRLLVRNAPGYPLVWAGSCLRDLGDFLPDPALVNAAFDPAAHADAGLVNFTVPQTVIWAGTPDEHAPPLTAVTFIADNYGAPGAERPEKWLYVVNAATGEVVYRENLILFTDVSGVKNGRATQGPKSDNCAEEVPMAMPYGRVAIGSTTRYADANGNFTIPNSGSSPVTVTSYMDGQYFVVDNVAGAEETLTLNVTPPGPANFMHNDPNTNAAVRAQVNGYVQSNVVRDWILTYHPTYPTIAGQTSFPVYVNRTDGYCPGNAWYDYSSINFCAAGGSYPNTAWSSVIYHEYGHHVVNCGGSGQDQYGEGMSDSISTLILDDPILGYGFFGDCNTGLRNAVNTYQYPCTGGAHDCGNLLSGCVWDTRTQLAANYPATYRQIIGALTVNSVPMHSGSTITPQITIDFLTLDDTDGNIYNGTPHYPEICAGFGNHNMNCPALQVGMGVSPVSNFVSNGQSGGPFTPASQNYTVENLGPTAPISYSVTTGAAWLTISNGTGTLATVGATAVVTLTINSNANSLPDGEYTTTVSFVNLTTGVGNTTRTVSLRVGFNDNCGQARTACPGTIYTGSTQGMNVDGATNCGTANSTPDVWYKYTPGSSGSATFTLCPTGGSTNYDAVMSLHSGCPGTSGNTLSCNDDGCWSGGPSKITNYPVTGGTTYYVRISGWNGAVGSFALEIQGPACTEVDTTPPSPNPMTFATPPAPASTGSITMTATTATDAASPPVSYYFDFVSGGFGGADSGWQTSTTYTNQLLLANTAHTYRVKARDSAPVPNETGYSENVTTATHIETPTGVSFGTTTANSIVLNAGGGFTNLTVGSSGLYFDSTTAGGDGGINEWVQVTTDTATGLSPDTLYTFRVKARNQNAVETNYGPSASKRTLANVPGAPMLSNPTTTTMQLDVAPNGNPSVTTFAVQCTASAPFDPAWNGFFVSASGGPSAVAIWQTDGAWGTITIAGLSPATTYTFQVKARNQDGVETALGPAASLATTAPVGACCDVLTGGCTVATQSACVAGGGSYQGDGSSCEPNPCPSPCALLGDVDGSGVLDGGDIPGFVRVKLGAPQPGDVVACADFGQGTVEGDVAAFVAALLAE